MWKTLYRGTDSRQEDKRKETVGKDIEIGKNRRYIKAWSISKRRKKNRELVRGREGKERSEMDTNKVKTEGR